MFEKGKRNYWDGEGDLKKAKVRFTFYYYFDTAMINLPFAITIFHDFS